jgi:hypothetical protein
MLAMAAMVACRHAAAARPQAVVRPATIPLLARHCGRCHGADEANGGFRLDTLLGTIDSVETADRWQKLLGVLNSGDMPPEDEPQLDPAAKADLLDDLARVLVVARKALADTGGLITMRRLNRREYVHSLEDLLGVTVEPRGLPADGGSGTFDTIGDGLFISADQIEQYHELAGAAIREAWRRHGGQHPVKTHRQEPETQVTPGVRKRLAQRLDERRRFVSWKNAVEAAARRPENQAAAAEIRKATPHDPEALLKGWERIQSAPSPRDFQFTDAVHAGQMGSRDWTLRVPYHALYASHPAVETGAFLATGDALVHPFHLFSIPGDWPPGDYVVRLRAAVADDIPADRRFMEFGMWNAPAAPRGCREITGSMKEPQVVDLPISVSADGPRTLYFQEKGTRDSDEQANRFFFDAFHANGVGPPLAIWIDWIEVEGPLPAPRPAALAELLTVPVGGPPAATAASAERDIRGTLERFCIQAFRGRRPEAAFLDRLVAIYERERAAGRPFREAVTESLAVVLSAPRFLYLIEPNERREPRQLDGLELASRLSFFLWSGPPDEPLLAAAASGGLAKPAELAAQVDRMLDDPRSRRFADAFMHQWLGVERLDFFQFKDKLYPRYDLATKEASRQEIFETFSLLLRENLGLRHLLKSDFVVVNSLLARYYGLEDVRGDEYRMVKLPEGSPRGGLLGMAAISAMGSNGEQTSPVERGAWVLRKLLHDPPPPAPPNVPQLTRLEGQLLTTRERLRLHQEEPQCASCHRKIDPIGFGLENFDAVGQWRTKDSYRKEGVGTKEWEIDPAGAFHGGPAFRDYFQLRDLVAERHADFTLGFTEALLSYALGRPLGFSDDDLVGDIATRAAAHDSPLRAFIHAVVAAPAFQRK